MVSRVQHKIQFARERKFFVVHYANLNGIINGWWVLDGNNGGGTLMQAYGPYLSKRQAKNEAYRRSITRDTRRKVGLAELLGLPQAE